MLKKINTKALIILGIGLLSTPVWAATDYSSMSTEELAAKRGVMREATQEERNAFQNEWQKRYREMSQEERRQYGGRPENASRDGSGSGYGQKEGEHGGMGGMHRQDGNMGGRGMGRGGRR